MVRAIASQLLTAAALLLGETMAYNRLQQRYIDNSTGTPQVIIPGASSYNGLNLVPQMGWNNWNAFHCDVNESLLLSTAHQMVDLGLRDLGYNYIVMDDCWSIGRNSSGYLIENRKYHISDSNLSSTKFSSYQVSSGHQGHHG